MLADVWDLLPLPGQPLGRPARHSTGVRLVQDLSGLIGSALFWVYAAGQLINGQLGDRVSARRFVAAGLLVSVALNLAFGFAASLPLMIAIWAANGYVQSMGWGPIVRTISHWFGPQRRGRLSALIGPVTSWGTPVPGFCRDGCWCGSAGGPLSGSRQHW